MRFNKILSGMIVLAGMTFLPGCNNEPLETPQSEYYARDFYKTFGTIAPDQDWTAASRGTLTVTTDKPTDVRIIADVDGTTYLFGHFTGIDGRKVLNFDIPKNATNTRAIVNGREYEFTPGSTLALTAGSRTTAEPGEYGDLKFSLTEPKIINPKGPILKFLESVPEDGINIRNVTSNFNFISKGEPITFYPFYWNTGSFHALGVYWYNKDEDFSNIKMQDLYYTKSHEITKSDDYVWEGPEPGGTFSDCDPENNIPYNIWTVKALKTKGLTIQLPLGVRFGFYLKVNAKNTLNPGNFDNTDIYDDINLKESDKGKVSHIVFSESELNLRYSSKPDNIYLENGRYTPIERDESLNWSTDWPGSSYVSDNPWENVSKVKDALGEIINPSENYCGACYKTIITDNGTKHTFFAFEDWRYEPDLNDVIFMFDEEFDPEADVVVVDHDSLYPAPEPTPDPEPTPEPEPNVKEYPAYQWIIACEDLGGTDDYDFNDIVFGVEHVAGSRYVYVTALAAGGTLPARLYYLNNNLKEQIIGGDDEKGNQYTVNMSDNAPFDEWHKWFGSGRYSTEMINTNGNFTVGATVRITLSEEDAANFSLSNEKKVTSEASISHLGGFTVEVEQKNGNVNEIKAPFISDNPADNIPQLFATSNKYNWPQERVSINTSHAGISGELAGTTPLGVEYNKGSFMHWVIDGEEADFHNTPASAPAQTCQHGWKGNLKNVIVTDADGTVTVYEEVNGKKFLISKTRSTESN